jgi:hypothetical protein
MHVRRQHPPSIKYGENDKILWCSKISRFARYYFVGLNILFLSFLGAFDLLSYQWYIPLPFFDCLRIPLRVWHRLTIFLRSVVSFIFTFGTDTYCRLWAPVFSVLKIFLLCFHFVFITYSILYFSVVNFTLFSI